MNAAAYRPLVVAYRNGSPVRLEDLGEVIDGVQNDKVITWLNNTPSIMFQVMKQPGTNTVEVVDKVRALFPQFREQLPPAINMDTLYDRSDSIRQSVDDVKFSLELAVVLVVLVIFLFLRNVSATLIPSLALPLSVIGTFAAMSLLGYTLDNLSLMALTLAVGFVVDDAIVVLENIVRHMEMGKSRLMAALDGGREIGFTILSMTLSLAAVFIPVFFMGGILGRLFHEFAAVIMVAILISGFVSLSLTPMLCSRFMKPPSEKHNALYRTSERFFDGMRDSVRVDTARGDSPSLCDADGGGGNGGCDGLVVSVSPKGFIPNQDTDQLGGVTEMPQDASFESMVRLQLKAAAVIGADPNVDAYFSLVNARAARRARAIPAACRLRLKPRAQRKLTPEQIIEELRPKLNVIPGVRTYLQNPPLIRVGGQQTRTVYQYTLQAQDLDELYHAAGDVREAHEGSARPVRREQRLADREPHGEGGHRSRSRVHDGRDGGQDRERAVRCIWTAAGVGYLHAHQRLPGDAGAAAALSDGSRRRCTLLYVRSDAGKLVPLDAVTKPRNTVGPLSVTHLGQLPSVTLSFNLAPGVSLGDAVDRIGSSGARDASGRHPDLIPRRGGGVPIVFAGHGDAAGDGDPGDLHGAGNSV